MRDGERGGVRGGGGVLSPFHFRPLGVMRGWGWAGATGYGMAVPSKVAPRALSPLTTHEVGVEPWQGLRRGR